MRIHRPAVALLLMACMGAADGGQVLRKGNGPEVETLDPHRAESVSASNVLRDLYEGLVREQADATLVPGTAERWTIGDEGRTYTFTLRERARWSNGDPVTADDFVAGFRRSADPATGSHYSQILSPILHADAVIEGRVPPAQLGVEAPDARTLVVRLKAPTPYFLGMLVHPSTYPVHRPRAAVPGAGPAAGGLLVSNGAYRLVERAVQSHIALERNPHYWDDASTRIDRVEYVNTEDVNSEMKRFLADELDWTYEVPANQGDRLRQRLPGSYHVHTYLGVYYYGFNLLRPPFRDNPRLRRALSLAIDRDLIVNKVLGLGEVAAGSWVPTGVTGHHPATAEWAGMPRADRLARARALYAEAGYDESNPATVELRFNTHDNHRKVATAIAAMWKQWLGVKTVLISEEWKMYLQNRRLRAHTQVFRAGWIGDYNDANSFLEILHSRHGLNDSGYANPRYDALLEQASMQPDPARRAALMHDAEALLLQDLPVLPIYFYVTKRLVSPRVQGWRGNIMDHHPTRLLYLRDDTKTQP